VLKLAKVVRVYIYVMKDSQMPNFLSKQSLVNLYSSYNYSRTLCIKCWVSFSISYCVVIKFQDGFRKFALYCRIVKLYEKKNFLVPMNFSHRAWQSYNKEQISSLWNIKVSRSPNISLLLESLDEEFQFFYSS